MTRRLSVAIAWLAAASLALFASSAPAADPPAAAPVKFDWSAWRSLPVLDGGRIKPLDTFAREHVEAICGRVSPTLDVHDQKRKFDPAELVFVWITQPSDWHEVAFLRCDNAELRKELGLPIEENGEKLKYASLADLQESAEKMQSILDGARAKVAAAEKEGRKADVTPMERAADEFSSAFNVYQGLLANPFLGMSDRTKLLVVGPTQRKASESLQQLDGSFKKLGEIAGDNRAINGILELLSNPMQEAFEKVAKQLNPRRETPPTLEALDADLAAFQKSLDDLARQCERLAANAGSDLPPALQTPELKAAFEQFVEAAPTLKPVFEEMASRVKATRYIVVDGARGPRVVPGLNPASYERNETIRRQNGQAAPWIDLQALLYAPKSTLEAYGYPLGDVETVRTRFDNVVARYRAGDAPGFAQAMGDFASSVRYLAQAAERRIKQLPVSQLDEALVAAVAYPSRDALDTELLYNRTDPFFQTWIVSFLAGICFALAFGWVRKPMIWAGFVLLLASIGVSVFGFALRVAVTKWAPVTNMYETVIYVSTCVAVLGAWFLMLPITWRGLSVAWRMTALPGSPEAVELTEEQREVFSPETYGWASIALFVPRLALAAGVVWVLSIADYAAGGAHIINLTPNTDYGSSIPNANNLTVWLVGLTVLGAAVWWVPRTTLSLLLSVVTIPLAVARSSKPLMEKVYEFPRPVFGMAAAFVACLGALVAWYAPNDVLDPNFKPLQPVLRDNFWLTIHVLTIVSSYAAGALAWGLGNIALGCYLFGRYRTSEVAGETVVRPPEVCAALAGYVYKVIQVAVLLLAAGTILGGLWADVSWGRFWGWDPKEVWALASLLVYLAILHGRYAGWFNNFGLAVGSVLGASAIAMSWYGVNFYLGAGLHSYGFGTGGQMEVFSLLLANWIFMAAAATRFSFATAADTTRRNRDAESEAEDEPASPDLVATDRT